MKLTRWVITYIVMASVGLWVAFFMSLRFMTPGHTQTPPPLNAMAPQQAEAPSSGDLPPEFSQENDKGMIPPPPSQPPMPPSPSPEPISQPRPSEVGIPTGESVIVPTDTSALIIPQFASDDQYTYDPTGHRDPFKPFKSYRPPPVAGSSQTKIIDSTDPLQRWDLDRFSVVAIMWEIRLPKAMVKDPDGKMYMIGKSTKIGRNSGQVVAIREGEVVVVEAVENEGVQTKEVKILELKK